MNGGPFRAQQPNEARAAATRPSTAPRQSEQPHISEASKTMHYAPKEPKTMNRFMKPIIVAVIVLLLVVGGWFAWSNMQGGVGINTSKYQAVFFTNGQVYFGKLKTVNNDYLKLTDIFYLQAQNTDSDSDKSENPQPANKQDGDMKLIKLGDEIHGPEDEMMISKDQVLFFENLKSDGKVTKSIEQYKKQ